MVKKSNEINDKNIDKTKQKNFYNTIEEAAQHKYNSTNTNLRYPTFCQTHFTAGDKNQFDDNREYDTIIGQKNIDLVDNYEIKQSQLEKATQDEKELLEKTEAQIKDLLINQEDEQLLNEENIELREYIVDVKLFNKIKIGRAHV